MPRQTIDIGLDRKHGHCSLVTECGRLAIVLPRGLFGGKQKLLFLNLTDNPSNRAIAASKLKSIQTDIDLGHFDPTLERYKHQGKKQDYLTAVSDLYPEITLFSLWGKYFEYKKPTLKHSTICYYQTSVTRYLKKSGIESPYQALELREWLLTHTSQSMAKRVLTYVNAAFKWGIQHKLIKGNNPYEGMPNELKHRFQDEAKPNAFTYTETQAIITTFANHKGNWNGRGFTGKSYRHYTNFVKFLFMTGSRPNEAVGLRWKDVREDFKKIRFDGGLVQITSGQRVRSKNSKNNQIREFPCNLALQELLRQISPDGFEPDDLVFPSPTGKSINYGNFNTNAWSKIVDPIKPNTTPYCCRDTFITEQILKGVNPAIVARWCDTSTQTIEKHYFDLLNVNHILPQ